MKKNNSEHSSSILKANEANEANMILPHFFSGRVRHGYQQGRLLGLPTANIHIPRRINLEEGIYVGYTRISPDLVTHPSLVFWGTPHALSDTVGPRMEVHFLNKGVDVYQKLLGVTILAFLRENKKFADETGLREAMAEDMRKAREYFNM